MNTSQNRKALGAGVILILIAGGLMTIQAGGSAEAAIQTSEESASVTPEGARKFIERDDALRFVDSRRPCAMGPADFHHPRHGNSLRASGPGGESDHRRSRRVVESLRTPETAGRGRAKKLSPARGKWMPRPCSNTSPPLKAWIDEQNKKNGAEEGW